MSTQEISLNDRYNLEKSPILLNGTQALVRMMMMQKVRDVVAGLNTAGLVTGYRGSPLGAVDMQMERALKPLTEHEITFATRDKINTTTCTPGRMMSVDPIGQTAGTCLLTNHPTISKTKNVWLSLKGTHAVTNTTKYHGHTFDKQHCFFNTHFLNTHMYFFPLVLFVQVHVKSSKRYCITMN